MRIAVIGAGPCGLSCAYELLKRGHEVAVYERELTVGGLSKSLPLWGRNVELGPHFLPAAMDLPVKEMLAEVMHKNEFITYRRRSRIYMDSRFIDYPPGLTGLLRFWGIGKAGAAIFSFLKAAAGKKSSNPLPDFESYMKEHLGSFIFQRFFKEYTEKLWQLPCTGISREYARSLIGVGDLGFISMIKKLLPAAGKKKHRHCLYPKEGMSMLWAAMQAAIEKQGGNFYFGAAVSNIREKEAGRLMLEAEGHTHHYDSIVSTVPEARLLTMLHTAPPPTLMERAGSLQSRNVLFLFLQISQTALTADHTLYLHDRSVKCVRITNCNRFRNERACGFGILLLEYWLDDRDPLWLGDECLLQRARKDLSFLPGGLEAGITQTKIIRLPRAIPAPSLHNKGCREEIGAYLNQYKRIFRIGRANQDHFNYGMEEALKDGLHCARENF